jgi:hypothetical protein
MAPILSSRRGGVGSAESCRLAAFADSVFRTPIDTPQRRAKDLVARWTRIRENAQSRASSVRAAGGSVCRPRSLRRGCGIREILRSLGDVSQVRVHHLEGRGGQETDEA